MTAADPINDVIPIVDVSDTTMAASGTTKKISVNNILSSSPTASGALTVTGLVTAGSATITGAATVGTTLGVTGVSTFAAGTALLPALTTTGDTNTGIYYPAADTFGVTTGGTERYRVDSTGLGIGVSPSYKLDLLSTGYCESRIRSSGNGQQISLRLETKNSDTTDCKILLGCGVTGNNQFLIQDTANTKNLYLINGVGNSTNAHLWYSGTATATMTLDASGNLLVGSTTNPTTSRLFLQGNGTNIPVKIVGTTGDTTIPHLVIDKKDNNTTTSQLFIQFVVDDNGAGSGQINANGANQAAFGTYSDSRLKKNIVSLPSQLANILSLRPVEFDYKDGNGHQIGFIAQEMQEVYADAVGEQEGFLTVSGWNKTEARLVSAIKELAAKVQALEAKLA